MTTIETMVADTVDSCCTSTMSYEIAQLFSNSEVLICVAFDKFGMMLSYRTVDEIDDFESSVVYPACDSSRT